MTPAATVASTTKPEKTRNTNLGRVSHFLVMNSHLDQENAVQATHKPLKRVPLGEIAVNKRKNADQAQQEQEQPSLKRARGLTPTYTKLPTVQVAKYRQIYGEDESDDTTCVPEYVEEIFELLYARQVQYMVDPDYMSHQPEIKWSVRGVLVNWLLQVHNKFLLLDETLYLCINIMDRYLAQVAVPLQDLQLVGTAALLIASKYEEVFSPALENFAYVSKTTADQVVAMEAEILRQLQWDLGYVNPLSFLRRISKADDSDTDSRTMAKYIMEISLLVNELFNYRPSDIAAAAMYLGRRIAGPAQDWDTIPELVHYSGGLTSESLAPIVTWMVRYMVGPVEHPSLFKKYSVKKYLMASINCRSWSKRHAAEFLPPDEAANISVEDTQG